MPNNLTAPFSCANFLARTLLLSLQETLGREFYIHLLAEGGVTELTQGFPPNDTSLHFSLYRLGELFTALEKAGGENIRRGLLQRSGRAWFPSLQRRTNPPLGIFNPQVLTLPKRLKIIRCGQILADYFQRYTGISITNEPAKGNLVWQFAFPLANVDPSIGNGFVDLWVGFWQELLYTLSGGKNHLLEHHFEAERGSWIILIPFLPFEG